MKKPTFGSLFAGIPSVGSTSGSNEPAGSAGGRSNGTSGASESSPGTGPMFPDMETSPPLTGLESNEWTCWPEVFRASHSQSPESSEPRPMSDGSGPSLSGPFASFDPDSCSWKTSQASLALMGDSGTYSVAWPRSGMTLNGTAYLLPPLVRLTSDGESGLWPTPDASVANDGEGPETWYARAAVLKAKHGNGNGHGVPLSIAAQVGPDYRRWPTPTTRDHKDTGDSVLSGTVPVNSLLGRAVGPSKASGSLNPTWVEWLMGFPLGWTDLGDSATRLSRRSSKSLAGGSSK